MAKYIKYLGLALIIIPAFLVIAGSFLGWQDNNILSLSMMACMIIGIVTYVIASKKSIENWSSSTNSEEEDEI